MSALELVLRRHDRVSTRLRGRIVAGDRAWPVTVLSLSEGGLYAEGRDLDQAGSEFVLEVALEGEGEPTWSPKNRATAPMPPLRAPCSLLYLDFGRELAEGPGLVGVGARFDGIGARELDQVRQYIAQILRTRERRPRGGAVPRPPTVVVTDPQR